MLNFKIEGLETLSREQMKEIEGGCSVSCAEGYFACCNPDSCKCMQTQVGLDPQGGAVCGSGGAGATSCMT